MTSTTDGHRNDVERTCVYMLPLSNCLGIDKELETHSYVRRSAEDVLVSFLSPPKINHHFTEVVVGVIL